MNPLVSVVTAAYNAENTIRNSIESVLCQDYDNIELIVAINGCTDDTENIVKEIQSHDDRVNIVYSQKGKVPARNAGFVSSRGSIIALNDADDVWLPNKLSRQIEAISNGYDIVGGAIECIDGDGNVTPDPIHRPTNHDDIVRALLRGINPLANSACIFKKDLLNHTGTYDDCFPFCEDYHFWLRSIKFARFANLSDVVMRYFSHPSPGYDHQIPMALAAFYRSLYSYTGVVKP